MSEEKRSVCLLTFHYAQNFGAVLQAYALQRTVAKLGFQPIQMNYHNAFLDGLYRKMPRSFFFRPKTLAKIALKNAVQRYNPSFQRFVENHLVSTSERYDQCLPDQGAFDFFAVGSVQVWNMRCNGNDANFFLPGIPSDKKVAYAVSTGSKIRERYGGTEVESLISDFKYASFRESDSAKEASEFLGHPAPAVLDPTLLLSSEEWASLSDYSLVPKRKYVLVYMIAEDRRLLRIAKEIAKQNGFAVLYINLGYRPYPGVRNLFSVTPKQWLGLFEKADYVATNSFHGLCFSTAFRKPFSIRTLDANPVANNRILGFLEHYSLTGRLTSSINNALECDYASLETNIVSDREASIGFLKTALWQQR